MGALLQEHDVQMLILGAVITLVSSITSLLIQNLIGLFLKSKGKVKIYVKTVYNKTTQKSWGFQNSINGMIFDIPLWIEIHNTKAKKEVVRDLSLNLYYQGQFVEKMIQVTHSMKSNEKIHYGNNGSYSFLLYENEIKRYDLEFILSIKDCNQNFDTVKISFYDTKDHNHEYDLFKISNSWEISNNEIDKDWRLINKNLFINRV